MRKGGFFPDFGEQRADGILFFSRGQAILVFLLLLRLVRQSTARSSAGKSNTQLGHYSPFLAHFPRHSIAICSFPSSTLARMAGSLSLSRSVYLSVSLNTMPPGRGGGDSELWSGWWGIHGNPTKDYRLPTKLHRICCDSFSFYLSILYIHVFIVFFLSLVFLCRLNCEKSNGKLTNGMSGSSRGRFSRLSTSPNIMSP